MHNFFCRCPLLKYGDDSIQSDSRSPYPHDSIGSNS